MATLDEIRAAVEAKYIAFTVDLPGDKVARLNNVIRLPKATRAKLSSLQADMKVEGADQEELLRSALMLVAETPAQGRALLAALGDDLAMLAETFSQYAKGTQAGEA